jgi:hypothetical protein
MPGDSQSRACLRSQPSSLLGRHLLIAHVEIVLKRSFTYDLWAFAAALDAIYGKTLPPDLTAFA